MSEELLNPKRFGVAPFSNASTVKDAEVGIYRNEAVLDRQRIFKTLGIIGWDDESHKIVFNDSDGTNCALSLCKDYLSLLDEVSNGHLTTGNYVFTSHTLCF